MKNTLNQNVILNEVKDLYEKQQRFFANAQNDSTVGEDSSDK